MNKSQTAVVIGRFQPFHNGHAMLLNEAFDIAEQVIVVVGSAHSPRTFKNPFTFEERRDMILDWCSESGYSKALSIVGVDDDLYEEERWVATLQSTVQNQIPPHRKSLPVTLVGYSKDDSSYYLNSFDWKLHTVEKPFVVGETVLDATTIRKTLYEVGYGALDIIGDFLPKASRRAIMRLYGNPDFETIVADYNYIVDYKKSWEAAPYPPTFVTADAVVTCKSRILLIRRGYSPGRGQLALPGGFIESDEEIKTAIRRELLEETQIDLPSNVIDARLADNEPKVFSSPNRSSRGRTITFVGRIRLRDEDGIPRVRAASDADKAIWVRFMDLKREEMFEDHYDIISNLL